MSTPDPDTLRAAYNATLTEVIEFHHQLRILRVRPDAGTEPFEPGQYTVLGLGNWEPRIDGFEGETAEHTEHPETGFESKLTKRAYSFSCTPMNQRGEIVDPTTSDVYEFFVVLIPNAADHVPLLTPRLFALQQGDRLFIGPRSTGHYSLDHVRPDDNVLFIATGTGEAPHNVMVAWLLSHGHRGKLASVVTVREKWDLAYLAAHREIESRFLQYRYLTLTTREPENVDPSVPGYVGKKYVQDMLESGELARDAGFAIDPKSTHVFLCGNPAMIGAPERGPDGTPVFPQPTGMVELLTRRGFTIDAPREPGTLHFEKYWIQ